MRVPLASLLQSPSVRVALGEFVGIPAADVGRRWQAFQSLLAALPARPVRHYSAADVVAAALAEDARGCYAVRAGVGTRTRPGAASTSRCPCDRCAPAPGEEAAAALSVISLDLAAASAAVDDARTQANRAASALEDAEKAAVASS